MRLIVFPRLQIVISESPFFFLPLLALQNLATEVKRSSRGLEDEVDLFARLCGIHASQINSRVARSGDTVDFEDIFRLAVEGFKASRDLYS